MKPSMRRSALTASVAACFGLGFAAPLLAAEPTATGTVNNQPANDKTAANAPAQKCLSDLRAFDNQMQKDDYWLGGAARQSR